ncbi:unnamed protein product [Heligmosomoides polygyrus]|uniref:CC domain-containing protein n=1 Tax=Heligmosomoides polygyrus TaxID=6339 RepID=A0A183GCU1_HELPZ|nr:unnamed protein product [Heligmosomoides polygyrus]
MPFSRVFSRKAHSGPPYPVNNNIGVGYPTAYGLGRGNWGNGLASIVRCLNGGAHIGQCRLEDDAICTALGGVCIHSACCTTPYAGYATATSSISTTTMTLPEVDGEPNPLEVEEIRRIIEQANLTKATGSEQKTVVKLCVSGLRPVGGCLKDDDCPALHTCEEDRCCYIA